MSDRLFRRGATWFCWFYDRAGRRHRVSTKCTDRRAALQALRELERQAQDPNSHHAAPQAPHRLSAALDAIVNADTTGRSTDTLKMYAKKGGTLLRLLGDADLAVLQLGDVERYVTERLAESVARETVRKELVTLRRALEVAHRRGHVKTEPRSLIPEFRVRYVPRTRFLEEEKEFPALLAAVAPERRLWVLLAVYAGARSSEVESVRWESVDMRNQRLLLAGTKTAKSRRWVPIAEPLLVALKAVPKAKRVGQVAPRWSNVRRALQAACAAAEIDPVSPNDLRRTFASWLKQRGVDSMTVARLLGHSTSRMVELVYGHLDDRTFAAAVATLAAPRCPTVVPRGGRQRR